MHHSTAQKFKYNNGFADLWSLQVFAHLAQTWVLSLCSSLPPCWVLCLMMFARVSLLYSVIVSCTISNRMLSYWTRQGLFQVTTVTCWVFTLLENGSKSQPCPAIMPSTALQRAQRPRPQNLPPYIPSEHTHKPFPAENPWEYRLWENDCRFWQWGKS